jgi:hypothetical protein
VLARLADAIRIVDDLGASAAAAADPAASVEEGIALVTRLELDVNAELVCCGWRSVGYSGILQFLKHFLRAGAPTHRANGDVRRRLILGLKKIFGINACCEVFDDDLIVLATRLI